MASVATFCLLHGAWHDPYCWQPLAAQLRARGHDAVAPDLPFHDRRTGYQERVGPALEALQGAPDPVMVVDTGPTAEGSATPTATPNSPAVLVARAEVFSVDPTPDGQTTVVSIITTEGLAPAVVQAGAKGGVSLVLLGGPASR